MAYTITFRRKSKNRFKRVRRKNWAAVMSWLQRYGEGCSMIHIRNLDELDEEVTV